MARYPEGVLTPPVSHESVRPDYYARYFGDPLSRLFWSNGHLHLGILPSQGAFFRKLIEDGTTATLVSEGWIAEFELTSSIYPLIDDPLFEDVYRLAKTPRIIFWYEWSPKMLHAATLHMIQLLKALLDRDLTLRNPHPWNLMYDGTQFQYLNAASIVSFDAAEFRKAWDKVLKFLLRPTILASQGQFILCRSLLRDIHHGVPLGVLRDEHWQPTSFEKESLNEWLARILVELEPLPLATTGTSWLGYHTQDRFQSQMSWARKQLVFEKFLRDRRPRSVLDLAANSGHYARIASANGCETIATDVDDSLVDQIFHDSRLAGCALYPAILDFTNPAPAFGAANQWFPAATGRMNSDFVLGYALEHHLVCGRYRLDFDEVAAGFAIFSLKTALIEYIPGYANPPGRSIEKFIASFRRFFARVEVLPGCASTDRQIIICDDKMTNRIE